jgi:hypothetical protein
MTLKGGCALWVCRPGAKSGDLVAASEIFILRGAWCIHLRACTFCNVAEKKLVPGLHAFCLKKLGFA